MYVPEIFPTSARSLGAGVALVGDQLGQLIAPYVMIIEVIWVPYVIFGALSASAAVIALTLTETRNKPIPETLKEMKNLRKPKRNATVIPALPKFHNTGNLE